MKNGLGPWLVVKMFGFRLSGLGSWLGFLTPDAKIHACVGKSLPSNMLMTAEEVQQSAASIRFALFAAIGY